MVNYIPADRPFYPTDHCGVLKVDISIYNPHFVKFVLEKAGLEAGFSRSFRDSLDRVSSLELPKVPIHIQDEIIMKVEDYQYKIKNLDFRLKQIQIEQQNIIKSLISI